MSTNKSRGTSVIHWQRRTHNIISGPSYVGDGRSAGHDTMDRRKDGFRLRMATEGGYLQDHMYVSNLI
jgi:hypothetical protein